MSLSHLITLILTYNIIRRLTLEQLPNLNLEIKLHVIDMQSLAVDLVIDRDFSYSQEISVYFSPANKNVNDKINLFLHALPKDIALVIRSLKL